MKEKDAWNSLIEVTNKFLGNTKDERYKEIVNNMIKNFGVMKINQSLKIHFLANHIDTFPMNLGAHSDEHGERFHQDIAIIESRFKSKNECRMLEEYCWSLCRENGGHKRQCNRLHY